MTDGNMETENQIKRFIYSGYVGDDVENWDELLIRLGNLLDRNQASEYFPGGIMFEDENGKYHSIWTEAVIRKVLPGQLEVDPWDGAEVDLPTGKGVVIKEFLLTGNFNVEGITEGDELLSQMNTFMNRYSSAQDDVGEILFENADGDYFVVTVESVMSTPDPQWVEETKEMLKDES